MRFVVRRWSPPAKKAFTQRHLRGIPRKANRRTRQGRRCLPACGKSPGTARRWMAARVLARIQGVTSEHFEIRPANEADRLPMARLFAAVAEERNGIAAEPPVDIERRAARWELDRTFVAVGSREVVGLIFVIESGFGFGEIAMLVAADWRARGVGTALVETAIEWARAQGLHKLTLSVFPHNEAAIGLYRKLGFTEEGRHPKHIRRTNGELWDLIDMGLPL